MSQAKKSLVGLTFLVVGFSGAAWAQDERPDQAAIVDSFKHEIQDVLKNDNARRGVEHATVDSVSVETPTAPAAPAKSHLVKKDGTPCGAFHTGWCHEVWVDGSGAQYVNSEGKPCNPASHPDTCHTGTPVAKPSVNIVWWKKYTETVSEYGFDVKVTDSLVTPYTGVFSYTEVDRATEIHPTKEEAEKDNNFTRSWTPSHTFTYGYQDGKWILKK
jgi:hypothetical protein